MFLELPLELFLSKEVGSGGVNVVVRLLSSIVTELYTSLCQWWQVLVGLSSWVVNI